MNVTFNPSSEGRNWRQEIYESKSIQPVENGTIAGNHVVADDGIVYLNNGLSVFSQPQHKTETLVSERFYWCLGLAGQNRGGNYLGHIFPGRYILNQNLKIVDNEVEMIHKHGKDIVRILTDWRDDGLEIENLGIFGGRVWKEGDGRGYLEGLRILGDLSQTVFGEAPRVIGLPTKGMVYENSAPGEESQTVFVGREGILIHTESPALEHPIAIGDVPERVARIIANS